LSGGSRNGRGQEILTESEEQDQAYVAFSADGATASIQMVDKKALIEYTRLGVLRRGEIWRDLKMSVAWSVAEAARFGLIEHLWYRLSAP
jgi:hypothetical protein